MQNEDNESGFNPKQLEEEIKNQQRIVNKKEESLNTIQKNPKASLAIAGIVFAALVIGMIAVFGGVGMINGELLGKVILTGLTAGTAAFGAKKLYDAVKGDKDKHLLRELKRTQKGYRRMQVDQRAKEVELALANKKKEAEDKDKVDMVMGKGWKPIEGKDREFSGPGNVYGKTTVELNPEQKALYDQKKALESSKKEVSELARELLKNQTESLDSSIKILSTKLGKPVTDSKKTEGLKELLDADVKKSDGTDLDASGSDTNKESLKKVLRAGLGLDSDGNSIMQDSPDFIDPQGRINILKELNNALESDGTNGPKFKDNASRNDKEVVDTLVDLMKLVNSEKTRTKEAKAKSAGRGGA